MGEGRRRRLNPLDCGIDVCPHRNKRWHQHTLVKEFAPQEEQRKTSTVAKVAALVTALGFDSKKHWGRIVMEPVRGLQVYDSAGKPVEHFSEAQLRALHDDPNVVNEFAARTGVSAPTDET